MGKWFLLLLLVVIVAVAWSMRGPAGESDNFLTVGPDDFEKLIGNKDSVVILDVRTLSEFQEDHLRDALLIDVKTDSFMMAARDRLPKDKTIAVYCRSGRRSAMAAEMLAAEGFKVVNLDGGIIQWRKSGKETVR